jgi:hypothetical protein
MVKYTAAAMRSSLATPDLHCSQDGTVVYSGGRWPILQGGRRFCHGKLGGEAGEGGGAGGNGASSKRPFLPGSVFLPPRAVRRWPQVRGPLSRRGS